MEKADKRDFMAAILLQKVMGDRVIWLGESKMKGDEAKTDEEFKRDFKSLVVGTYVLVDKMLDQS